LNLFWVGLYGEVRQGYWTEGDIWKVSKSISKLPAAAGSLAVVSLKPGHLEVFWIAPSEAVYHAYWETGGAWQSEQLPGLGPGRARTNAPLTVVSRHGGTVEG